MIQKITIKNFLSFKDEVTFSFEASNDRFAEDYQVVKINDKTRLLRFAVVYGYNASGKSNLLKAIDFLRSFWFRKPNDLNEKTGVVPFKLDSHSPLEHTKFELVFYVDTTKYAYLLELDNQQVYTEKLSYYKSEQPTMLFDRRFENGQSVIDFGSSLKISKIVKDSITVNCLKNMSFFAASNQVNTSIELLDIGKMYLRDNMMPAIQPSSDLIKNAQIWISEDETLSNFLLYFLYEADFNISNIQTESTPITPSKGYVDILSNFVRQKGYSTDLINNFIYNNSRNYRTTLSHSVENEEGNKTYQLSLDDGEESMGTARILGIGACISKIIKYNWFQTIDEIETSLHPKLLEKILFEFLKAVGSQSQLIVTTHNDGLLDLTDDLIRKDSVWFTEKQKNGATDLYKLTDFRGVNRLSSIREAYRNKRFGATMNS